MNYFLKISLAFLAFCIASPAFAYVDPGTGSAIVSIIIGAIVGSWLFIKSFWYKISNALKKLFKVKKN